MKDDQHKDLSTYDRWLCKRGQTLVEHLVVILFVTILSVAMLPIFMSSVIQAWYQAEAIPALESLRMRITLGHFEPDQLPGLGRPSDGVPGGTSQLAPDLSKVQTVASTNAVFATDFTRKLEVASTNHVLSQLGVSWTDLSGRRLRPQHFQYRVDAAENNRQLYAIGVFGDSTKRSALPVRTGYAVLEWQAPGEGGRERNIAFWLRCKGAGKSHKQVVLVSDAEARSQFGCDTAKQSQKMDLCWIGDPEALLSPDAAVREKAKAALQEAGWNLGCCSPIPWYRKRSVVIVAIPLLLLYALSLLWVAGATFAEKRFHWKWGIGLGIWLAVLMITLPMSPVGPLACFCGVEIVLVMVFWTWDRILSGFHWIVRRFRREETA